MSKYIPGNQKHLSLDVNFFSFFNYLNREVFAQDASYLPDTENLANRSSYEYIQEQVDSMFQALEGRVEEVKERQSYSES